MITFDAKTHTYHIDNIKVKSVTQVLQEERFIDFSKVPRDILQRALAFGTAGHKVTELYDLDDLLEGSLDPALRPYLDAWIKFKKDTKLIIEGIEEKVGSKKYYFAGRLDRRAIVKEAKRTVIDIKLGEITRASALQTAAYQEAFNEGRKLKEKIKDRLVVQLKGDGNYYLPPKDFYKKSDFGVFLSALNCINFRGQGL